jgi:hypothetical protein
MLSVEKDLRSDDITGGCITTKQSTCHTSLFNHLVLTNRNISMLQQPAYSPDLSPQNFQLFQVNFYKSEHGNQFYDQSCSVQLLSTTHFQEQHLQCDVFLQ